MKKIISAFLAALIIFSSFSSVYASNIKDIFEKVEGNPAEDSSSTEEDNSENDSQTAESESETSSDDDFKIPIIFKPTDQLYMVFEDIIDLYIEKHLYEFDKEELINKFFYDMIANHPEMYEMMINTLLGTMDRYSTFHDAASGFLSLESDSAGYGVTFKDVENGILIQAVSPDSEAEKAGILPGDVIVGLFGYDTKGLGMSLMSTLLKRPYIYISEKGEDKKYPDYNPPITITIDRNGELIDFTLKKGVVVTNELSSSYMEMDGQNVAYISVSSFIAEDLSERFLSEIQRFKNDGYTKLVIDLRNNGGGSLQLALEMAEVFVENGKTICYYNDKNIEEPEAVISTTDKIEFDSISVLVNQHTASAAELMAYILRDSAGAVLVGKKTFGKALGQTPYPLGAAGYITITTYEILGTDFESYNGIGLTPELALDNVEMLYVLPKLEIFNHQNYKEIEPGVYSEPCLALEKRLAILGYLKQSQVDGIWNDYTSLAVYFLQSTYYTSKGTGYLDDRTVTLITDLINNCKDDTYLEDSQLQCALLYHSAFDQARRLIKEKERLSKKQAELIKENNEKLEAEAELAD